MDNAELQQRYNAKRMALGLPNRTMPKIDFIAAMESWERGGRGSHVPQRTDSPIETMFEGGLIKYLRPEVRRTNQREIQTAFGRFRADVHLTCPATRRVLVVECDGADFHDGIYDDWRDAALIGSGSVHDVLRIEGKDLVHRPHDVWLLMLRMFPSLFLPRATTVLAREASAVARAYQLCAGRPIWLVYPPPPTDLRRDPAPSMLKQIDDPIDEPIDDPVDEVPRRRHATYDEAFDDFMCLQLRGRSPLAEHGWQMRFAALRRRQDLTIRELADRERQTGLIG